MRQSLMYQPNRGRGSLPIGVTVGMQVVAKNGLQARKWLPLRDSNPDMPLQRRLSYR